MKIKGTLFLTLRIFSATGGIEKVSRQVGKALYELLDEDDKRGLAILSMYDQTEEVNEKYFPETVFKGYRERKLSFVWNAIRQGIGRQRIVLSHINLLSVGFLIKLFSPKTQLVLLAHGIEVWEPVGTMKNKMLHCCDLILAVSQYTKNKLMEVQEIEEKKLLVLNNSLDPFLPLPVSNAAKEAAVRERYGLKKDDIVLMTLTRLSSKEKYKGYDSVLHAIKELKIQYPSIKYLVVGMYDKAEKRRLDAIIDQLELTGDIIFAGFVPDSELAAHFAVADLYIMPSKKEGFGIVFIEAMYYGKPVIAGNKDGSADALCNGRFGLLIDPDNVAEIKDAIATVLSYKQKYIPVREEVTGKFGFNTYKENLKQILENLSVKH